MVKETSDILELVLKIFGIIGGLVAAYVFIRKAYKSYAAKRSKFFTGSWSNEGNIRENRPSHYIDLTLSVGGTKVYGSFNIRKEDDPAGWNQVSLEGRRFFYSVVCNINHVRDGKLINYGKVILKKTKERNLGWKLKKAPIGFFLKKMYLIGLFL